MMKTLTALIITSALISAKSYAENLPLWEVGVGTGLFSAPHYLGSDQRSNYILPLPYAIYRGEYIQSGHGGLGGKIYDSQRLDLRISLGGAIAVDSEDNDARTGMPDLGYMLEVGPTLQYSLVKSPSSIIRLDLPVRAAFSFDSQVNFRGITTNPKLYTKHHFGRLKLATSLGPSFGTKHYHDYFYSIEKSYILPDRGFYIAQSGYTGFRAGMSLSKTWEKIYSGIFINYYNLKGARNQDSPLMKSNHYLSFGIAVSWIFLNSKKQVDYDYF